MLFRLLSAASDLSSAESVASHFDRAMRATAVPFDDVLALRTAAQARGAWRRALLAALACAKTICEHESLDISRMLPLIDASLRYEDAGGGHASTAVPHQAALLLQSLGKRGDWAEAEHVDALRGALNVLQQCGPARNGRLRHASALAMVDMLADALERNKELRTDTVLLAAAVDTAQTLLAQKESWERRQSGVRLLLVVAPYVDAQLVDDALLAAVDDDERFIRASAMRALATVGCVSGIERAGAALGHSEALVRRAAVDALCEYVSGALELVCATLRKHSDAFDHLMFDGDWEVKRALIALIERALLAHSLSALPGNCLLRLQASALLRICACCEFAHALTAFAQTLLDDSARLVRIDAAQALLKLLERYKSVPDAAQQCSEIRELALPERLQHDIEPRTWNTDFEGAGGMGAANFHFDDTDDEGEADADDDLPLDCE